MANINYEEEVIKNKKKKKAQASYNSGTCGDEYCGSSCGCNHEHSHQSNKTMIIRISISAALLIFGLIINENQTVKSVIFGLSLLTVGYDVFISAAKKIVSFDFFDENLLMIIAAVCAFLIKEYPEGAAVVLLFRIGGLLEDYAVGRSRKSISSLMELKPDRATVLKDDRELTVPAERVNVGDIIVVRPGERVPLDGQLLDDKASFDTSAITGEALPRTASLGDPVLSGCINLAGAVKIVVTQPLSKSTVSRILEMVESANAKKAAPERIISRYAKYYTPAVIAAAALVLLIPTLIFRQPFAEWLNRALVFLVVSCPCALVISVPLAYFAGIGGATKKGILFKGSSVIDSMTKISAVVFDKTGTLTTGKFSVTDIDSEVVPKDMLFMMAAYAEYYSNHPLAQSVISAYGGKIDKNKISEFKEIGGRGVSANISGVRVLAGTAEFIAGEGIDFKSEDPEESIIYVAANGNYIGKITLADTVKKDTLRALDNIRKLGVERIVMMTGDRSKVAQKTAVKLGIREIYSEYLPSDKLTKLNEIMAEQSETGKTVFVGDGINDSPVLAAADIGISMGGLGSDAAIEASDIVIMNDEPEKIAEAVEIATGTKKIVIQNIIISLGFKFVVMLLGVAGIAPLWLAVFADVGVAVIAILNSIRAYDFEKKLIKFN